MTPRRRRLLSFGGGLVTRGMAALGASFLSIAIGRTLGPAELGEFSVFVSLLAIGAIFGRRGLDMILMREVAVADLSASPGMRVSLLRAALRIAAPSLLVVAAVGAALLLSGVFGPLMPGSVVFCLLCIPMLGALMLISGYMKGAGQNWLAPLFEIGGVSLFACAVILAAAATGTTLRGDFVLATLAGAMLFSGAIGGILIQRDGREAVQPSTVEMKQHLDRGQLTFTIITLSALVAQSGSFLIVAPFLDANELGLVRAAERLALIVSFPALVIRPYIAPRVVQYMQNGTRRSMIGLLRRSAFAGITVAAIPLIVLLLFPVQALALFGDGFAGAAPYLRTLAAAHAVILLLSPISTVLNMGGGERANMWIGIATLIASAALFPLLSIAFGAWGFVVAYAGVAVFRVLLVAIWGVRLISRRYHFED